MTIDGTLEHADDLHDLIRSLVQVESRRCASSDFDGRTHHWHETRVTPSWLAIAVLDPEYVPRPVSLTVDGLGVTATPTIGVVGEQRVAFFCMEGG